MDERFNGYATRAVPRYTSYPTAPHWTSDVTAGQYAAWLEALDPDAPISLYLHVPFCRQLCWYCGCNMKLASRGDVVSRYAGELVREIELVAAHLPARMALSHVAWGGGTPTALSPDDLARAMETVRERFAVLADAEVAIECDPRTLSTEMTRRIGTLGFNRASFGVQEFDPTVQAAINRIQPPPMVAAAVDGLRAVGVESINFDLIYGLPHQTVATLLNSIDLAVEMEPDRIALFGYAHVPWMARKQRMIDEAALPGAGERLAQAEAAARAIIAAGYVPIGLDHFARPNDALAIAARSGTLRRNFQGYTTDDAGALIGVGASAIGRTPHGFVQNAVEPGAWGRAVAGGALPVAKGRAFAGDDVLRGRVIEALMCNGVVDLWREGARCGAAFDWFADAEDELVALEADGLIVRNGHDVIVTDAGKPFARVIAAAFDAYLPHRTGRHSVAV